MTYLVASLVVLGMIDGFVGCFIAFFLAGMAVMGLLFVFHGNPRADQLEAQLRRTEQAFETHVETIDEMQERHWSAQEAYAKSLMACGEEINSLHSQLNTTSHHNGDLQTKLAGLEKDIIAINAERVRLQTAVDVAREGRDAAEATATAAVQTEMAELRSENGKLKSERDSYAITVTNCDHFREENERLTRQLKSLGVKPAEVQEAEHDYVGAGHEWCAKSDCQKCNDTWNAMHKPPRVRDDEAND